MFDSRTEEAWITVMSSATLITRVNQLAAACEPLGFLLDGPFRLKRSVPHIDQFIEIQPGHDWLDGQYTCNLCWKYTADGIAADDVYDHAVNVGWLTGDSELWMNHESKDVDKSDGQLESLLLEAGIPFLDRIRDLRRMIEMYEAADKTSDPAGSPTDPRLFFGVDAGWKHYNLAFAYKVLGDSAKAKTHFNIVLEQHSDEPFTWVGERRRKCAEALAST